MATSRDDFVIAFRSAFLKKKDKQKFSLLTLFCFSYIKCLFWIMCNINDNIIYHLNPYTLMDSNENIIFKKLLKGSLSPFKNNIYCLNKLYKKSEGFWKKDKNKCPKLKNQIKF